jgi:PilZ domain
MALVSRNQNPVFDPMNDRRALRRARLTIQGKIFFQERQYEEACLVLDLSPNGAGLKSACAAELGSPVVLYVDGLGRFDGTIIRHNRLYVGVQFKYSAPSRERIANRIANYLEHGTRTHAPTRKSPRIAIREAPHSFMLESGETHGCEIADIALSGASFKTAARPAVGQRVFFGKTTARVVRHTETGFAVMFSDTSVPNELGTSRHNLMPKDPPAQSI